MGGGETTVLCAYFKPCYQEYAGTENEIKCKPKADVEKFLARYDFAVAALANFIDLEEVKTDGSATMESLFHVALLKRIDL